MTDQRVSILSNWKRELSNLMQIPHSKLFKHNNERLVPTIRKKAVIVNGGTIVGAFSGGAVDLYFLDNPQSIIKGVPVSDTVYAPFAGALTNKRCVVDIFDESNTSQMVVAYTY